MTSAFANRSNLPFLLVRWRCWFLLMALAGAGCSLVRHTVEIPAEAVRAVTPGTKSPAPPDPVEVQQRLLRLATEFGTGVIFGVDKLERDGAPISSTENLRLKIFLLGETCAIVSGPSSAASLIDLTVFTTVVRASLKERWKPEAFKDSAAQLVETFDNLEVELGRLANTILTPQQREELRQAIVAWQQQHPLNQNVLGSRASGFALELTRSKSRSETEPGSVFALLRLDPLAGLDPAMRELARTRLFAERALFLAQWMPTMLRWQTELLAENAVAMPGVQQMLTNSTRIATSVERFAGVAEQLPAQLRSEREEILKAIETQETRLTPLVNEVRLTLASGTQLSTSLNTTITTFDGLMKRFGIGETNGVDAPNTNREPFRITDYGQTAVQLEAAARQLTELLRTLDQTLGSTNVTRLSAEFSPVVQQAQTSSKEIVDYAFWRGLVLILTVFGAALIYRLISSRLRPGRHPTHPTS